MPRLGVIVGSTRPGRIGLPIATWVAQYFRDNTDFEVDFIDLAEVNLPVYNEPKHPRLQQYQHEATRTWSARIEALDALVIVTPEYNHFAPPALVNALDYLQNEWRYLPVAIASYGGVSAGLRSAETVRSLVTALRMYPIVEAISIPGAPGMVKDGVFTSNNLIDQSAKEIVAELGKVLGPLTELRRG